jgi:hypothetical protein
LLDILNYLHEVLIEALLQDFYLSLMGLSQRLLIPFEFQLGLPYLFGELLLQFADLIQEPAFDGFDCIGFLEHLNLLFHFCLELAEPSLLLYDLLLECQHLLGHLLL